ncbi:MAG: hypothetical protein QOJ35_3777 [Solirubrobacteraceae bacterium]|nr:hypothetical protein [Solirubrobacteraceae bacterium]
MERLLGRMGRIFAGDGSGNGRSLAYVWGFGASCLTVTILLPHPAAAHVAGLVAVAIAGYVGAALLFLRAARFTLGALEAITYVGQLLITALTLLWGAPDAPFLWFHVWLVVHSFHFLPPVRATRQIACAAVLYVAATVATHAPFPAGTSVVGVGTIVAIGMLVGAFRVRVDELLRSFARSAALDPLTGLANRRAFSEAYAAERARRARSGGCGALMVLDCDGFKRLNDRRGHAAGDRALCRIAGVMSSIIREIDTASRLGGDEFAVLLSATDPGSAAAIGDRIRAAVAAGNDPDGMTISIGIVELPARDAIDESAALAAADRAMYRAKDQGGDCVSLADLPAPRRAPALEVAT